MRIKKWLMKQQWRILQIRGIWGIFYGVLVLAGLYVGYFPFFVSMGILGPFVFAGLILFSFLILGYIYDRVLVMWAVSQEVTQERNPYQYVPAPKDNIFWFPVYSAMLDTIDRLAEAYDVDRTEIAEARAYYAKLQNLRPERKEDIEEAILLREAFVKKHPFRPNQDHEDQV